MLIIPAIDIKDGKCVRLYKGDFNKSKTYYENPVEIAKIFQDHGAKLIHLVDLDGAKKGEPVNLKIIEKIIHAIDIKVEYGGGIRTKESIIKLYNLGIKRLILGTKVIKDIKFLDSLKQYIDNIIISIDLNNEYLSTHGWLESTHIHYKDYIKSIMEYNIKEAIITDINKDGTLEGPNFNLYKNISLEFPELEIIVSGGISNFNDIKQIVEMKKKNIKGIITGKAIYEKKIDLKEVLDYVSQTNNTMS